LKFSVDPSALDNYPMGMAPLPIGAYPYARSYAPAEGEASLYGQSYAQQYAPDESSGQGFFSKLMDVIGKGLANWPDKTMPYVVSPEVAEGVTNTATQGRDIPNSISVDFYREASDFGLTPPEYEQLISEVTSLVRKNKNNAPVLNQIFQELAKSGLTVQALDTLRPDWWVKLRRELTQG